MGAAVSISTVPPAVGDAGQAEVLPSASFTWNSTYSLPSTWGTLTVDPVPDVQLPVPVGEVRYAHVDPSRPEPASVAAADTCVGGVFVQLAEPPDTVTSGTVRSSHTSAAADHAEELPTASTLRNCTWFLPSPVTATELPEVIGALANVTVGVWTRYSYTTPPESVSVDPEAVTGTEASFCHVWEPPDTVGTDGASLSTHALAVGSGTAGTQAETLPALSTERNWTSVFPVVATVATFPVAADDHVEPGSSRVWYW